MSTDAVLDDKVPVHGVLSDGAGIYSRDGSERTTGVGQLIPASPADALGGSAAEVVDGSVDPMLLGGSGQTSLFLERRVGSSEGPFTLADVSTVVHTLAGLAADAGRAGRRLVVTFTNYGTTGDSGSDTDAAMTTVSQLVAGGLRALSGTGGFSLDEIVVRYAQGATVHESGLGITTEYESDTHGG